MGRKYTVEELTKQHRLDNETLEEFRERRKKVNKTIKKYLKGSPKK